MWPLRVVARSLSSIALSGESYPLCDQGWRAINTINEYMIALDRGDTSRFAALFTREGRCVIHKTGYVAVGPADLAAFCASTSARFRGAMHLESNPTLRATADPGICTNESYWQALLDGELMSVGLHSDVLERQPTGEWLFKERVIYHTWSKAGGRERPGGVWEGIP